MASIDDPARGRESSPVAIRSLERHEVTSVLELWLASDATPSVTDTAADLERLAGNDHASCLVATSDSRIVGSIIATFDGWRGNVYRLAVHPDYRRRGLARSLVTAAEQAFARWGVRRISALVETEHEWAVEFWRAAGYQPDPRMTRFVRSLTPGGTD
jgi:ribosomal protein S18 acetylase RimI-like enzyme